MISSSTIYYSDISGNTPESYSDIYEAMQVGYRESFISDYLGSQLNGSSRVAVQGKYCPTYQFKMAGADSSQTISYGCIVCKTLAGKYYRYKNSYEELDHLKTKLELMRDDLSNKSNILPVLTDSNNPTPSKGVRPNYVASKWFKYDDFFYLLFEEVDAESYQNTYIGFSDVTMTSFPENLDAYEPIEAFSFAATKYKVVFHTYRPTTVVTSLGTVTALTIDSLDAISEIKHNIPHFFTAGGVKTVSIEDCRTTIWSANVTVTGLPREYSIEKKSNLSNFYAGKPIGSWFGNLFRLKCLEENDYYSATTVVLESLIPSNISLANSKTRFAVGDTLSFTYTYNNEIISFADSREAVSLASNLAIRYSGLRLNLDTLTSESIVDLDNISFTNDSYLTYSDGAILSISEVDFVLNKPSFTCSQTNQRSFKVSDVGDSFTIVVDLKSTTFGSNEAALEYDLADELVLSPNYDNSIWVGHPKTLPAYVELLKYKNGNLISRTYSFMNSYLHPLSANDYSGTLTLEEAKNTDYVTLSFRNNNNIQTTYKLYASYFENLVVDISEATLNYYVGQALDFVFDGTGVVISCTKVENNQGVKTSTLISDVENDLELEATIEYEYSTDFDLALTGITRVWITPKVTFTTGQILRGTPFAVNVMEITAGTIEKTGTDTSTYWNYINDLGSIGKNYFQFPSNLSFKLKFNDGEEEDLDRDEIKFSLSEDFNTILNSNSDIGKSSRIYFRHPSYPRIIGFYTVNYINEEILSVDLANTTENKFTFVKGNSPAVYTSDMTINVVLGKSENGNTVTSRTIQLPNINFVNPDTIVMDGATDIKVLVKGSQYTLSTSKISFVNPTINQIVVNENGFKKSYINGIDKIDVQPIKVNVTYTNAEYVQIVEYNDFTSIGFTTIQDNVTLDGTDVVNINMGNDSIVTDTIAFGFNEEFSGTAKTASVGVDIIEVLDVVGIGVSKIYNNYKVGDLFLNENDTTEVTIFYKDNDVVSKYTTPLRNVNAALNITPIKGTKFKNVGDRVIRISSATSSATFEYSINVQPQYELDDTETLNLVAIKAIYNSKDAFWLVSEEYTETDINVAGGRKFKGNYTINNVHIYGYLENIFDKGKNAKVTLYHDYIPPTDYNDNIEVTFPCYVEGNADKINKCQFGILFGNNNANNRLFLSGNLDEANCDWHSNQVDIDQVGNDDTILNGNFGYFSDRSYCYYGETDNKVVGYDIVSNDKLLVLKDKSDKETTIYFRTPTIVTKINGAGTEVKGTDGETLYQEEFALTKGNNSVAGVNPSAVKNFNGDSLFISNDNNICGLDLTGIVGDNQRYATTRSYFIDEDLRERDLSASWMWSDNKYLYLMLPEKIYLTHFEAKSEKQYEWWQINVGDVQAFLEYNGITYFANNQGNFFKIGDNYQDIKKEFVGLGATTVEMDGDYIAVSSTIIQNLGEKTYKFEIINENPVYNAGFSTDNHLYANVASIVNDSSSDTVFQVVPLKNHLEMVCRKNGQFDSELKTRMTKLISDGRIFYLNNPTGENSIIAAIGSSRKTYGIPYYLKMYVDNSSTHETYKVYNAITNEQLDVSTLYRANMVYRLDQEYDIVNIDKTENRFQIAESGTVLDIVYYGDQAVGNQFRAEIKEAENVEAFYITKPYDLGGLDYFKTIWQWTLTNDTDIPSELELTYASNKIPNEKSKTLRISVDKFGLDFDKFTFTKVDFDKNIVPRTYTEQRLLTNQKFICFGFKNYNNTNSVLSSMSILYSIPHTSYGSD